MTSRIAWNENYKEGFCCRKRRGGGGGCKKKTIACTTRLSLLGDVAITQIYARLCIVPLIGMTKCNKLDRDDVAPPEYVQKIKTKRRARRKPY